MCVLLVTCPGILVYSLLVSSLTNPPLSRPTVHRPTSHPLLPLCMSLPFLRPSQLSSSTYFPSCLHVQHFVSREHAPTGAAQGTPLASSACTGCGTPLRPPPAIPPLWPSTHATSTRTASTESSHTVASTTTAPRTTSDATLYGSKGNAGDSSAAIYSIRRSPRCRVHCTASTSASPVRRARCGLFDHAHCFDLVEYQC